MSAAPLPSAKRLSFPPGNVFVILVLVFCLNCFFFFLMLCHLTSFYCHGMDELIPSIVFQDRRLPNHRSGGYRWEPKHMVWKRSHFFLFFSFNMNVLINYDAFLQVFTSPIHISPMISFFRPGHFLVLSKYHRNFVPSPHFFS